ncbi:MAG: HD domain-containing protein, partial [Planctomycetota bacterium]
MNPAVVQELVKAIEAKDLSTAAHTWRVVLYARAMAEAFGVDDEMMRLITHGAALHDVGKIDIPSRILSKPGRLT